VTGAVGPVHGGLYLLCAAGALAARRLRGWSWATVVACLLPAVGGIFVTEILRREARAESVPKGERAAL
jgi:hypothetical protein